MRSSPQAMSRGQCSTLQQASLMHWAKLLSESCTRKRSESCSMYLMSSISLRSLDVRYTSQLASYRLYQPLLMSRRLLRMATLSVLTQLSLRNICTWNGQGASHSHPA